MTNQFTVPDNFPRNRAPGAVAGAQPKILVRESNGRYFSALTNEELVARYEVCADLAQQLTDYVSRKIADLGLPLDDALRRAEKGLRAKVSAGQWDFSDDEVGWMMNRTRELSLSHESDDWSE